MSTEERIFSKEYYASSEEEATDSNVDMSLLDNSISFEDSEDIPVDFPVNFTANSKIREIPDVKYVRGENRFKKINSKEENVRAKKDRGLF